VTPDIFVAFRLPPELAELQDGRFTVHLGNGDFPQLDDAQRAAVRALVTNGIRGADRALIDYFPNLEIIASLGIGLDSLDLEAARARKLVVTNTPGVVADDAADLALALLIDRRRQVQEANRFLLAGKWSQGPYPLARSLTGMTLGIVGLGAIGTAVARRAEAFRMHVKWYGPHPKPFVAYQYVPDLVQLAEESDALVIACAGGAATRHLINGPILRALGPQGILVNVARGSIVDTQALIDALTSGQLGAAALDVFEHQPQVPPALLALPNVLLTPHLGTATRETRARMGKMVIHSLIDHFSGRVPQHRVL
jgi:lactate dehydrogenase-like 2-hydroxyacid dehydrogenase